MSDNPELKRTLSLAQITFYGLGTILGAGIYVLVGKVAGSAGLYAPLAFVVAALLAGLTGLSYAELAARHPKRRYTSRTAFGGGRCPCSSAS